MDHNDDLDKMLYEWTGATGSLAWGVQRAFRAVFEGVKDYGTSLMYGADYSGGFPCLVNTVGTMLTSHAGVKEGGGQGVPSNYFGEVVSLFDRINRELERMDVNTESGKVSPLAAEIFLEHFAPEKPEPVVAEVRVNKGPESLTVELTDEALEKALLEFAKPAQDEVEPEASDSYYQ